LPVQVSRFSCSVLEGRQKGLNLMGTEDLTRSHCWVAGVFLAIRLRGSHVLRTRMQLGSGLEFWMVDLEVIDLGG
jgi:hypothetical protein